MKYFIPIGLLESKMRKIFFFEPRSLTVVVVNVIFQTFALSCCTFIDFHFLWTLECPPRQYFLSHSTFPALNWTFASMDRLSAPEGPHPYPRSPFDRDNIVNFPSLEFDSFTGATTQPPAQLLDDIIALAGQTALFEPSDAELEQQRAFEHRIKEIIEADEQICEVRVEKVFCS